MTLDERFQLIAHNFEMVHDSIKSLENIATAHEQRLDQIETEFTALMREWQAYLRRLPPQ